MPIDNRGRQKVWSLEKIWYFYSSSTCLCLCWWLCKICLESDRIKWSTIFLGSPVIQCIYGQSQPKGGFYQLHWPCNPLLGQKKPIAETWDMFVGFYTSSKCLSTQKLLGLGSWHIQGLKFRSKYCFLLNSIIISVTILWHKYGDESKNVGILNLEFVGYQINDTTFSFNLSATAHDTIFWSLVAGPQSHMLNRGSDNGRVPPCLNALLSCQSLSQDQQRCPRLFFTKYWFFGGDPFSRQAKNVTKNSILVTICNEMKNWIYSAQKLAWKYEDVYGASGCHLLWANNVSFWHRRHKT